MFVVMFERSGHFTGMTQSKTTRSNVLMRRDNVGMQTPFDTVEAAETAFAKEVADHEKRLRTDAKNAHQQNGKKTEEEYYQGLLKIQPHPCNPKVMQLNVVGETFMGKIKRWLRLS